MSLNWTAALLMQKLVLVGYLAQTRNSHALDTDIEMDSLATREPFPTSLNPPLTTHLLHFRCDMRPRLPD
jgi:hypothetical protein